MEPDELKKLLTTGETETVEFKENIGDSLFRTISALSNKKGGLVLLGIDKNGNPKGVDQSERFLEELTNRIVDRTSVYPAIEVSDAGGKRILIIGIPESSCPISYEGRYYERVGNTSREMSPARLRALLLKEKPWDLRPSDAPLAEMDDATVQDFVRRAVEGHRLTGLSQNSPAARLLENLDAAAQGNLTNGALLAFGKNPQKGFINASIRIGRFRTETDIIDDKWARGNLFAQFEEALRLIMQHISVRYEIKGPERTEIWDYPIPVLREALLNAIVHRDYSDLANFIQIKVYDDHVWFSSPGGLPEGITLNQLKMPHKSCLRNPLIARFFYLAGYIEQFGSGTTRMGEAMAAAGLPGPEFREEMGGFSVYLSRNPITEEKLAAAGLNERQIKAVDFVRRHGSITNAQYRELTGAGRRNSTYDLNGMVKGGIFVRKGKVGKGTLYFLKK
jgi:ATP-dependent DNA helicase RecG